MACNSTLKLIYRRSDHLEYVPHVIREEQPQMLILNKGSHTMKSTKPDGRKQSTHWRNMNKTSQNQGCQVCFFLEQQCLVIHNARYIPHLSTT